MNDARKMLSGVVAKTAEYALLRGHATAGSCRDAARHGPTRSSKMSAGTCTVASTPTMGEEEALEVEVVDGEGDSEAEWDEAKEGEFKDTEG